MPYDELAKKLHPSGINLAAIPGPEIPDKPEPTVKSVLRALAKEFQQAMRAEAEALLWANQTFTFERAAKCQGRYEAFREAYGDVLLRWDLYEFDGEPQPEKVWHTLQSHAIAIQQERQSDKAF